MTRAYVATVVGISIVASALTWCLAVGQTHRIRRIHAEEIAPPAPPSQHKTVHVIGDSYYDVEGEVHFGSEGGGHRDAAFTTTDGKKVLIVNVQNLVIEDAP